MDNSLSRLSRGNISTTSLSNGVSPNGSQVKIKMCAFSRSIKEHPPLHRSDCEREREIRREREAKRLKNHPVCKFITRRINSSRRRMDRLTREFEHKLQKLEQKARALLPEKDDLEETGISPKLYAIALANSSTTRLRARLSQRHDEREAQSESDPESVDVMELVCHESLPAARRLRANSGASSHTAAASTTRSDDDSTLIDRSSITSTTAINCRETETSIASCMRGPRTRDEEEALLDPATITQPLTYQPPSTSSSSTSKTSPSRSDYSSTLSTSGSNATSTPSPPIHTRRVLSISYANGNEEVEEPTIQNEDGRTRPRAVVCRWGDGVDEVIPG